jgi:hypothetical protein
MTRKEYVVAVVDQLKENPRAVLAGHGLPGAIVKIIGERPDVMAKLSAFGYSTVNFKKGAKGLKKTPNFKISGYKNFNEFNAKARQDVEAFMMGLTGPDAENFSNENNIITFIVLPDTPTGDTVTDIANLKSVAVSFNSSVKKEHKIAGGIYITIMFGDSLILPREARVAVAKEKINKKIDARKTPAKIKAELTAKAKSKLARIKLTDAKLSATASKTAAELEQIAEIGNVFGAGENASARSIMNAMKIYSRDTKRFLVDLPADDKKLFKAAMAAKDAKKVKVMYAALNEISPENYEKVKDIVVNGNLTTADKVLEARRKQMKLKIAEITTKNAELLAKAEAAPTAKLRANINFQIRKNLKVIDALKAKMKVHSSLNLTTIKNKAKLLADTNAAIEANREAGMSIQEALNSAIAGLSVDDVTKQQVKQQVVQQLATGTPLQFAVQQAIQNTPMQQTTAEVTDFEDELTADEFNFEEDTIIDTFGNLDDETADIASKLANSKTVSDILNEL